MRMLGVLIIAFLILSACSKPVGLTNGDTNKTVTNTTTVKNESTVKENKTTKPKTTTPSTEPEDTSLVTNEDRIDITTTKGKGHVEGTVKGVTKTMDTAYEDVDAILFDTAKLFKITLFEARYITYLNGNRYLKPSQLTQSTDAIAKHEDPNLDTAYTPYIMTWEDGFLRGVGCDRKRGIIVMNITQNSTAATPLYRDVRPRIKGAIVFRLNRIVLEGSYCEGKDSLEPDVAYRCQHSGLTFLEDRKFSVETNKTYSAFQNEIAVSIPGDTQVKYFNCPDVTLTPTKTNTTSNTTTNSTA